MHNLLNDSNKSTNCTEVYGTIVVELLSYTATAKNQPVEATHQTRKKLKLLRAFAKLIKPARKSDDYNSVNILFRDWGRVFSDLRDTHVRDLMLREFAQNSEYREEVYLIDHLINLNNVELSVLESASLYRADEFSTLEENLRNNPLIRKYFSDHANTPLILEGYNNSYLKSRYAFRSAFTNHNPEDIHEWRKRAKDLQYQTELLMSAESDENLMNLHANIAEICDALGAANDLHMLQSWIDEIAKSDESINFSVIQNKINSANRDSMSKAENRGKLFYETFQEPLLTLISK